MSTVKVWIALFVWLCIGLTSLPEVGRAFSISPALAQIESHFLPEASEAAQSPLVATPLLNPGTQESIGVVKLRSALLPGVMVGGHYEGIFKVLQQSYRVSDAGDEVLGVGHQVLEQELARAGYRVAQAATASVFTEHLGEEPEVARFLMGGLVTEAQFNTFNTWVESWTEDTRKIRWEVLDRETNRVIFQAETIGQARSVGLENRTATYEAIRQSAQRLLSQPGLIAALQQAQPTAAVLQKSLEIPARMASVGPLTTEQITRRSIPATVWIRAASGRGSGFLISDSGLILTNQHVVGSALTVKASFYDGSVRTARVLQRNAAVDVALLQVDPQQLHLNPLPICYQDAVTVGEDVVAIGNPLSLANTVTRGVISGIRSDDFRTLIQTDVAINPGNSGGPLLNRQGAVVGIVTEKYTSRGVEGLGFALTIGETLDRLGITVKPSLRPEADSCGNPLP